MAVLRWYEPEECDEHGFPLDWARCRTCGGTGYRAGGEGVTVTYRRRLALLGSMTGEYPCLTCDGHGSLKAAALYALAIKSYPVGEVVKPIRCEDCGHPMSDGTWEDPDEILDDIAKRDLLTKPLGSFAKWCERRGVLHYSRCDKGCRHLNNEANGLLRVRARTHPSGNWSQWILTTGFSGRTAGEIAKDRNEQYEASWRHVDVWTLGWPHDLHPEKLAVLCTCCWTERTIKRTS